MKMSETSRYAMTGLTCNHCVMSVTEETSVIPGVTEVAVDLHPEQTSILTLTSNVPLSMDAVGDAVREAGYELVGPLD